jgi:peptidylprolyl isomerase
VPDDSKKKTAAPLRSQNRSWVGITVIVLVVVLVFGGVIALLVNDDGGDDGTSVNAGGSSTLPTLPDTTSNVESAAGKPCVAMTGTPPAGAPAVPVKVGPPPTELVAEDLEVGTGAEVAQGATVTVDYIGVACSTGVIFDSSYSRGQPAQFPLDQVIPGWTQGLPGMKVGGSRLLGIPAELAYGDQGAPPDIAPGETLWFVVKVQATQ